MALSMHQRLFGARKRSWKLDEKAITMDCIPYPYRDTKNARECEDLLLLRIFDPSPFVQFFHPAAQHAGDGIHGLGRHLHDVVLELVNHLARITRSSPELSLRDALSQSNGLEPTLPAGVRHCYSPFTSSDYIAKKTNNCSCFVI